MFLKVVLFVVTFILFAQRVSLGTLRVFSKKKNEWYANKSAEIAKKNIEKNSKKDNESEKHYRLSAKIVTVLFICVGVIYYYMILSQQYGNYIVYMSLIQIVLTLYSLTLLKAAGSPNPEDYKIPFLMDLINLVVDYAYYPVVLYYLIINLYI